MRKHEDRGLLPATNTGPRPAAFPLRSLESRVAARTMAKRRAEQDTKEPFSYQAHFDKPVVIYDYVTGLPISEAMADRPTLPGTSMISAGESEPGDSKYAGIAPGPLPASGESIDDLPTAPEANPRIITVEIE